MKNKNINSILLFLPGIVLCTALSCATPPPPDDPVETPAELPAIDDIFLSEDEFTLFDNAFVIPPDEEKPAGIALLPEETVPAEPVPVEAVPDIPQLNLPPELPEYAYLFPILPEPPPMRIPPQTPEPEPEQFPEPEPDPEETAVQVSDEEALEEMPVDDETSAEIPAVPEPDPVPPVRETPPDPPAFLRMPEREVPREEPVVTEPPVNESPVREPPARVLNVPDPPVVHPNIAEERIEFSRIVRALVGQIIEIPFRGTGWVFLGEMGSRRGVNYDSRRLDPEGQTFVFRAEIPGTYILRFNKQDFIRDQVQYDYVQVIIGEAAMASTQPGYFSPPLDQSRIVAEPRWPLTDGSYVMPSVPYSSGNAPPPETAAAPVYDSLEPFIPDQTYNNQIPQTALQEDFSFNTETAGLEPGGDEYAAVEPDADDALPVRAPAFSAQEYLRRAHNEFDAGRITTALSLLDEMNEFHFMDDEALWLYAQLLEANSPNRDIRLALDTYRLLIREFPQSNHIPEAQQRINYLERYYFNIR